MSRISKRKSAIERTKLTTTSKHIRYLVAVYARLSIDTDEKKNESIDTQIEMIIKYVLENKDMQIYDIYQDLGKTGTNFERTEFNRMLQDIRQKDVNCVMVKDLSRFGRNYIETGNYIEKIFPSLGVRFIAIADHIDTEAIDINEKTLGMNIKNLMNEMYAKEFSKKSQVQIRQRMEQGIYVGSVNPYGYYTIKGDKKRVLYKETGTSDVIRAIFRDFSENHTINGVVRWLAKTRVNPPIIYQKTRQIFCPNELLYKAWATESVKRVLKNPIYLGMLVQGRSTCLGRSEKNRKWFDKSEWIVCENTHEPLVDKKVFDEIQLYFMERETLKLKEKSLSM